MFVSRDLFIVAAVQIKWTVLSYKHINNIAQDIATAMTMTMSTLLEQQRQQNNNFNNDFFNKPKVYDKIENLSMRS